MGKTKIFCRLKNYLKNTMQPTVMTAKITSTIIKPVI